MIKIEILGELSKSYRVRRELNAKPLDNTSSCSAQIFENDMGAVRARSVLPGNDALHAFVGYVTPLVEVSLFPEL
jgi:hypothetical protein